MDELDLRAKLPVPLTNEGYIFLTTDEFTRLTVRLEPFMQKILKQFPGTKTWTTTEVNGLGLKGIKLWWAPIKKEQND